MEVKTCHGNPLSFLLSYHFIKYLWNQTAVWAWNPFQHKIWSEIIGSLDFQNFLHYSVTGSRILLSKPLQHKGHLHQVSRAEDTWNHVILEKGRGNTIFLWCPIDRHFPSESVWECTVNKTAAEKAQALESAWDGH